MDHTETEYVQFLTEYLKLCIKYRMRVESDAHHVCATVCNLAETLNVIRYTLERTGGCLFHFSMKDNTVWRGANIIEVDDE